MAATLENLYATDKEHLWLKGNLHAHSTLSDGKRPPQDVIDAYAALKYDFMALTDHDVFSDYSKLDAKGMILLLGNEVTAFGPHVLQIGATTRAEALENRQTVIDTINAGGGFAVLNHPNWEADWDHYPFELMQTLKDYAGVEIYNGVGLDLEGSAVALDKWERLLSSGRMVWAFAHDDSHHPTHIGRGWNVVQVPKDQANAAGILAALRAGRFYASTGVTIDTIETRGTELRVLAGNAHEIEIYGEKGVRLARVEGSEIRFDAADINSFSIRVQCYGGGSKMAWTQPFVIRGGMAENRRKMEEKFSGSDAPRPELKALRVDAIGSLGSDQTDSQWRKAPESEVFYDWRTGDPPPVRTAVKALVDGQQLALRIECEEPEMAQIRARITEDGNGSLWTDESVEIFLDVEGNRQRYYHMMVNPLGAFFAGHPLGWAGGLKYKTRAQRGEKGWAVEVLFDLATLAPNIALKPGSKIGLHVCRNRLTVGRHYMWSWVGSSNHTPGRYGWLEM